MIGERSLRIVLPPRRRHAIPLTSLVDVVFILLFFFMLASSYLDWRAFPLSLAPAGGADAPQAAWTLRIATDGAYLNGRLSAPAQVRAQLAAGDETVRVVPGPGLSLQSLVDWLDRLERWGVRATLAQPEGA